MTISPSRTAPAIALVVAVWLLGFAIIAHHNPFGSVDSTVMTWMFDHRSSGLTAVATAVTDMFSPVWVGLWTLIAAVVLILRDRTLFRAAAVIGTVAAAGFVCEMLKLAVNRLRPPSFDQVGTPEAAMSFPSGHVTGTSACVIGLAVVAFSSTRRVHRTIAVVIAMTIAVGVALTRLYLGAHWLSDVTAALALGTAAALVVPPLVVAVLARIEPHTPTRWHHFIATEPISSTRG